jgi:hypothetical protein
MRNVLILSLCLPALVAALAVLDCSSSARPSGFTADAGSGGDDAAVDGGDDGSQSNLLADASPDAGPACPSQCSTDGRSVLDCQGKTLQTCTTDQACGTPGVCMKPCDAATANKSTIGCDYYSVDPDVIQEGQGACFAAYVANTWSQPVTIGVERGGTTYDATKFAVIPTGSGKNITYAPLPTGQLPPGGVAILFLATSPNPIGSQGAVACPVGITPAITTSDAAVHGTTTGQAFRITTSAPVVAYDIFPYGGGDAAMTSATLLVPTSAWDTNYIAVNAFPQSQVAAAAGAQPSLDIVAMDDNTTITIASPVAIQPGMGVAGAAANTPASYKLAKGQVLQFTQPDEMSGAPIQSDKPIGVWGAASCLNVDPNTCCCDSAHQQIPPVKALGHEYAGVRYRNRDDNIEETPPWRLVGAVNGTKLVWVPAAPQGAPAALEEGQVVEFNTGGPFVVRSQDAQHPFFMSGHMSGCETYFGPQDCRGDAEFVDVVPTAQWLSSYVFFTDPTYPETNLVVTRTKQANGFKDVTLDCFGTLTGWKAVDAADTYEYTRIDLVRHNFEPQGKCDNGRHEMKSDAPFGLTVWGWGSAETGGAYGIPQAPGFYTQAVSYAYPAGMAVVPVNTVVVPPMAK